MEGTKEEEAIEDSDNSSVSHVEEQDTLLEIVLPRVLNLFKALYLTVKAQHHTFLINLKDMLPDQ